MITDATQHCIFEFDPLLQLASMALVHEVFLWCDSISYSFNLVNLEKKTLTYIISSSNQSSLKNKWKKKKEIGHE